MAAPQQSPIGSHVVLGAGQVTITPAPVTVAPVEVNVTAPEQSNVIDTKTHSLLESQGRDLQRLVHAAEIMTEEELEAEEGEEE